LSEDSGRDRKEILATENTENTEYTEILKYYLLLPSLFFVNTANHFYILIWNKSKLGKLKKFCFYVHFFLTPLPPLLCSMRGEGEYNIHSLGRSEPQLRTATVTQKDGVEFFSRT
jgi:hypothetical protein